MFINVNELQSLSSLDSLVFDREGYLFVKQRNDRLFNQWKSESFVERFVRLKGNLLLIIATKTINDSIDSNGVYNSSNDRCLHILVLEEFAIKLIDESNKYYEFVIELNRNELIRSFHFATISHEERDQWIQSIHLSSFMFLRSLHKTLLNELNNTKNKDLDESIETSNYDLFNSQRINGSSSLLSISCDHILLNYSHKFDPKLVVYVYYKTIENFWQFLGKTEISSSRNPRFYKCLTFPKTIHRLASIELKFNVFNVIETITNTKCLLGFSYFTFPTLSESKIKSIHRIDLKSLVTKQSIGALAIRLSQTTVNSEQSLRKVLSFDSIVDYKQKFNNTSNRSTTQTNKSIRTYSLPNILSLYTFENMSNFDDILISKLFSNTICKSFQFSIPKQKSIAFIDEYMSESQLSFAFPQTLMNIFMNDEKKLMNCITYSIGEVKTEYQRNQMRALECHLRLVNVLTESLNEISLYSTQNTFRPSTAKSDSFLQFIPINYHLQRCLVSDADTNRAITHDIFTVGAYCCHYLGFESGGIKSDTFDPQYNSKNVSLAKTWNAMKNFFRISSLRDRIYWHLKELIDSIDTGVAIHEMLQHLNKMDELCKEMVAILSSKQVDESLAFCELVRGNDSINSSSVISNSMSTTFERTVSLEETRKTTLFESKDLKRHRSLPNDEQQELEPIDLIHLNIKASVISINSKLMNKNNKISANDLDPSKRKLKNAIDSLFRTASICYASSGLRLDREQIELFYRLRLRRHMILSQALTALIVATLSKLSSVSFIQRAIETRSILSEHEVLLSCYAEELGMLEDMAYALNQINTCVKFIFEASDQLNLQPRIEGNSFNLRVIFSVHNFPSTLKAIECSLSSIIFNVGINELATLAETFGSVKLQESINKESYSRLEAYVNRIFVDNPLVSTNMSALKTEIWSNRAKNVRILDLAQQVVQSVDGLRFTSCKSAKDRTSMAVTLEEARICAKLFKVCELTERQWFQNIIDTLRSEGTRRENTRKNVGIAKYAFNSLQLLTFPKLFRAPNGTYSSIET